ncbi:MAG: hypothetical protein LQ348_001150 [Seirophora lacunosa]|nr:MAG: hypothetical protein LQ348_001150 [Seirophora lacunosa]
MSETGSLTGDSEEHVFSGFLFDLDGTIIETTDALTKHWKTTELGVDHRGLMDSSRGRRSIDTIRLHDPSKATWEYVTHIESLIPHRYGSEARETPGARQALEALEKGRAPWALVTSCTRALLDGWLELLSLPRPAVSVTAEDVASGKPDPACYALARERCGLGEGPVLVVEDSPAGVRAGKAAGCMVFGLVTTHSVGKLRDAGADWLVENLDSVRVVGREGNGWRLTINRKWLSGGEA